MSSGGGGGGFGSKRNDDFAPPPSSVPQHLQPSQQHQRQTAAAAHSSSTTIGGSSSSSSSQQRAAQRAEREDRRRAEGAAKTITRAMRVFATRRRAGRDIITLSLCSNGSSSSASPSAEDASLLWIMRRFAFVVLRSRLLLAPPAPSTPRNPTTSSATAAADDGGADSDAPVPVTALQTAEVAAKWARAVSQRLPAALSGSPYSDDEKQSTAAAADWVRVLARYGRTCVAVIHLAGTTVGASVSRGGAKSKVVPNALLLGCLQSLLALTNPPSAMRCVGGTSSGMSTVMAVAKVAAAVCDPNALCIINSGHRAPERSCFAALGSRLVQLLVTANTNKSAASKASVVDPLAQALLTITFNLLETVATVSVGGAAAREAVLADFGRFVMQTIPAIPAAEAAAGPGGPSKGQRSTLLPFVLLTLVEPLYIRSKREGASSAAQQSCSPTSLRARCALGNTIAIALAIFDCATTTTTSATKKSQAEEEEHEEQLAITERMQIKFAAEVGVLLWSLHGNSGARDQQQQPLLYELLETAKTDDVWSARLSLLWTNPAFAAAAFADLGATTSSLAPDASRGERSKTGKSKKKKKGFFETLRERAAASSETSAKDQTAKKKKTFETFQQSFRRPTWLAMAAVYLAVARGGNLGPLNSLTHMHLLRPLWDYCCSLSPVVNVFVDEASRGIGVRTIYKSNGNNGTDMLTTIHVSYSLLAATCGHLLMITDDASFEKGGVPFAMSTMREVVQDVNRLLFAATWALYSGAPPDGFSRDEFQLRANSRRMLRMLVDRAVRVPSFISSSTDASAKKSKKSDAESTFWLVDGVCDTEIFNPSLVRAGGLSPAARHVLFDMPHVVPFSIRAIFIREFVAEDRHRQNVDAVKLGLKVRRSHVLQDGFEQLASVSGAQLPLLRARWHLQFIDQHGKFEPGIDAGGVFKEFIETIVRKAFNPEFGLFLATSSETASEGFSFSGGGLLYPNPHARGLFPSPQEYAENYRFLGRILGKAIYEGVVVPVRFAPFFLNNVLGRGNSLDDLRLLDPQQHRALQQLKDMEDVEDAYLFFCVEEEAMGTRVVTDIIDGGRDIQVTNDNVIRYMHLTAHHLLVRSTKEATAAFVAGMCDVLERPWITVFSAPELQQLISGGDARIDIGDLRAHTKLVGGFREDSRTIKLLWEVLEELSADDQGRFLAFCTGSSRPPLLGFEGMTPPFSIRLSEESSNLNFLVDIDRLPSASTCFNLLKLPGYKTKTNMREKLLQAIRSGAGFDLS